MTEKKSPKATISIDGPEQRSFETIRQYMIRRLPGITPNSADVLRHALHLAAEKVGGIQQDDAAQA